MNKMKKFLTVSILAMLAVPSAHATIVSETMLNNAISGKANSADLADVATSGSYNDLSNKPTIPTVNNATLTIQKNGTDVATFTANQGTAATANITVPTTAADVGAVASSQTTKGGVLTTNASTGAVEVSSTIAPSKIATDASNRFVTDSEKSTWSGKQDAITTTNKLSTDKISGLAAVATSGSYGDLTGTPTIPTVNNATLTIQKNGTDVATFTANQGTAATANITVPTTAADVGAVASSQTTKGGVLTTNASTGAVEVSSTIAPSKIATDASNRFVTDSEKSTWSGKQDALGYTAENSANKVATEAAWIVANNANQETVKYPTISAVDERIASKLNDTVGGYVNKGSATNPVYFNNQGVPTAITSYEGVSDKARKIPSGSADSNTFAAIWVE